MGERRKTGRQSYRDRRILYVYIGIGIVSLAILSVLIYLLVHYIG